MDVLGFFVNLPEQIVKIGELVLKFCGLFKVVANDCGEEEKQAKKGHGTMSQGSRVKKSLTVVCAAIIVLMIGYYLKDLLFTNESFRGFLFAYEKPVNEQLTTAAWAALNSNDLPLAIKKAEECIDEFGMTADREQAQLEKNQTALPPTGGNISKKERDKIFQRGLLNDVATCFFIRGKALEKLGKKDEAKEAYKMASKYTYARCFDPRGGGIFWEPAQSAADRLVKLNK